MMMMMMVMPDDQINAFLLQNLQCELEGGTSLALTLTGSCVVIPESKEVLGFTVPVRQRDTKDLTITNRTDVDWKLRPMIEGDYWSGPDVVVVRAQTTHPYQLTYCPLAMTTPENKHVVLTVYTL
jgi:hydrocephalus-inducing protein